MHSTCFIIAAHYCGIVWDKLFFNTYTYRNISGKMKG